MTVVLPDLAAGCSMADMAEIEQVEDCWEQLGEVIDAGGPDAGHLRQFGGQPEGVLRPARRHRLHVGQRRAVLEWAFSGRSRVLFFPDQHLGRNTALRDGHPAGTDAGLGSRSEPELGGNTEEAIRASRVLLWQGPLQRPPDVPARSTSHQFRQKYPGIKILVHPECMMEVVDQADVIGSTGKIIQAVEQAPPGTKWAIGTELHLVNRLKHEHPEQEIHFLSPVVCMCATMYRIDLAHLCWAWRTWRPARRERDRGRRRDQPLVAGRPGADAANGVTVPDLCRASPWIPDQLKETNHVRQS